MTPSATARVAERHAPRIRLRFTLLFATTILIVLLASAAAVRLMMHRALDREFEASTRASAALVAQFFRVEIAEYQTIDATVAHLKERKQFGKSLAEFQGIQFQTAQAATELEAARLMVYNAARLKDAGHDIARQGAMAKLYSSQMCERVTSLCVELFGGYGYTREYPVEKFYRDAKIGTIYEGTSNMQLQTIAKAVLR